MATVEALGLSTQRLAPGHRGYGFHVRHPDDRSASHGQELGCPRSDPMRGLHERCEGQCAKVHSHPAGGLGHDASRCRSIPDRIRWRGCLQGSGPHPCRSSPCPCSCRCLHSSSRGDTLLNSRANRGELGPEWGVWGPGELAGAHALKREHTSLGPAVGATAGHRSTLDSSIGGRKACRRATSDLRPSMISSRSDAASRLICMSPRAM